MRIHSVTTCKVFIRGSYCIFRVFFRDQSKSHTYYRSIIWGVCQAASLLLWLRRVKIPILAKGRCCYLNNREIIYKVRSGAVGVAFYSRRLCAPGRRAARMATRSATLKPTFARAEQRRKAFISRASGAPHHYPGRRQATHTPARFIGGNIAPNNAARRS